MFELVAGVCVAVVPISETIEPIPVHRDHMRIENDQLIRFTSDTLFQHVSVAGGGERHSELFEEFRTSHVHVGPADQ